MSALRSALQGFEYFVLVYFSVLCLTQALAGYVGLRAVLAYSRELSKTALKDLLHRDYYEAVSILVPAFNQERTIVVSLRSMLKLEHPDFEIIVANDGSTDRTMDVLIDAFALAEVPVGHDQPIRTSRVRRTFRSARYPTLTVVDKANGGRADAINAALNVARNPLVCVVDADSVLDGQALIRASRPFVQDETVVGVGGTIRPLNGAIVKDGVVVDQRAPKRWVERVQVLEYALAFFANRAAWSRFNMLTMVSSAFGLFRRSAVLEVEGWWTGTVSDDMDMSMKLHRHHREQKRPCKILFTPDTMCWTEMPWSFRGLARRSAGLARGLLEVLWRHRRMLLDPRYGRIGMVAVPYRWIFEAGAIFVETLAYAYLLASWALGLFNPAFAVVFGVLAILYRLMLSQLAVATETLLLARYPRGRDRAALMAAAVVEHLGMRQAIQLVRFLAAFPVQARRGRWWNSDRQRYVDGAEVVARAARVADADVAKVA